MSREKAMEEERERMRKRGKKVMRIDEKGAIIVTNDMIILTVSPEPIENAEEKVPNSSIPLWGM